MIKSLLSVKGIVLLACALVLGLWFWNIGHRVPSAGKTQSVGSVSSTGGGGDGSLMEAGAAGLGLSPAVKTVSSAPKLFDLVPTVSPVAKPITSAPVVSKIVASSSPKVHKTY